MNESHVIRILIADDHPMIRSGLAALITTHPDLLIVAESANGQEAVADYATHRPDVTLMDLRMPVIDGLAAIRSIVADDPNAKIILLTTYDGDADIPRALEAGARGFLLKDMLRSSVVRMIRSVHGEP